MLGGLAPGAVQARGDGEVVGQAQRRQHPVLTDDDARRVLEQDARDERAVARVPVLARAAVEDLGGLLPLGEPAPAREPRVRVEAGVEHGRGHVPALVAGRVGGCGLWRHRAGRAEHDRAADVDVVGRVPVVHGDLDAPDALGGPQPDARHPPVRGVLDVIDPAAQPVHRAWQFVRKDQQFARTDQGLGRATGSCRTRSGTSARQPPTSSAREVTCALPASSSSTTDTIADRDDRPQRTPARITRSREQRRKVFTRRGDYPDSRTTQPFRVVPADSVRKRGHQC